MQSKLTEQYQSSVHHRGRLVVTFICFMFCLLCCTLVGILCLATVPGSKENNTLLSCGLRESNVLFSYYYFSSNSSFVS